MKKNMEDKSPGFMESCTRFQLILGFLVIVSVIILSTYQLDMLSIISIKTVSTDSFVHPQEQRKQQLREMCESVKRTLPTWNRSLEDMSRRERANFLVDDEHGIIYCYIPKVACTNWKRIMIVLRQGEPFGDPTALKLVHTNPMIKYLTGSPREELKAKLKHYTKFLFVRSPFIRLISAYRDKFEHYKKAFYDGYGRRMLRLYGNQSNPPTTSEEVLSSGVRPSFNHFVQYLLDPRTPRPLNEHWKQMHRLCHPCLVEYDFIGHQETLQDDAKHLLKILKIDNKIEFPPAYKNVTTKDYLLNYFKSVSIEDRQKLYQMYEMDFKLFGYPKPDGLLGS